MLYTGITYVLIQNLVQSFLTLFLGQCINTNKYQITSIFKDALFAFFIAIVGLIINDSIWLIIFVLSLLILYLKKGTSRSNYEELTGYVISCILQIIFLFVIGYIIRLLIWPLTRSFSIHTAMKYGHSYIVLSVLFEIAFSIILVYFFNKYRTTFYAQKQLLYELHVEKQVFLMIMNIFISMEIVVIISEIMSIASVIQGVLIITFSLIVVSFCYQTIMLIKAYSTKQEALNIHKQNTQLNGYMTNIEQQYTEFRKFKHDYKNLLLSLKTMIDTNDSKQLKSYYNELSHQDIVQQTNDAHLLVATDKIENEPIRGLLIQKFFPHKNMVLNF